MNNEKELVIRMAEAEEELVAAMNSIMQAHSLPCFLLEPVVDKLHRQLIDGKKSELEMARRKNILPKSAEGCTKKGNTEPA